MSDPASYVAEKARRSHDGLEIFRALPGAQEEFFRSTATELVMPGGVRAGKTTCSAVKFAAVVRNKSVYMSDGTPVEQRLPHQKNRALLTWIVGLQWTHIGDTIWRVLFKPGLFKIMRDGNGWRTFDPVKDKNQEHRARPSFPLIPFSEVKGGLGGIGWEVKKERQFNFVELKNGTIIRCWASTGEVKQGDPVDYIWIDEEIAIAGHYAEWQSRLSDTKGRIVWSTLTHSNAALLQVMQRATEQEQEVAEGVRSHQDVQYIRVRFSDNPFIDADEKRKRNEGWSEDDRLMRDEGQFLIGNIKVYPAFDRLVHCAVYPNTERDDELSRVLRENNFVPPSDWTRDFILDPGTAKPAGLFMAIPPPEFWAGDEPYFVAYDEIYKPRIDAGQMARLVASKSRDFVFERFTIDGQAAKQKPMGFSGTIGANYSKEFAKVGLTCNQSGSSFVPGDPNFESRHMLVNRMLAHRESKPPQLRVIVEKCPNLVYQLENNLKATQRGPDGQNVVLDKPAQGQKDDLRDALEYYASRYPFYVEPPKTVMQLGGPGFAAYERLTARFKKPADKKTVEFGPGAAT